MNRQKMFIQNEIDSLKNTVIAINTVLNQWQRNAESGKVPAETRPSIQALQKDMETMHRGLTRIEGILAKPDE